MIQSIHSQVIAMASSSSSSILQPEQQQQAGAGETLIPTTTPEAVPTSSAWKSSGSIGPFFAVISVLTVLAVLSCYLARKWSRRPPTPLESIENRGCFGWLNLMCRRCIPTRVQVGSLHKTETMDSAKQNDDCKDKDSEVAEQNPQRQV